MTADIFLSAEDQTFAQLLALFPEQLQTLLQTLTSTQAGVSIVTCEHEVLQEKLFDYFRTRLAEEKITLHLFKLEAKHPNIAQSIANLANPARIQNLIQKDASHSIVIFVYGLEQLGQQMRRQVFHLFNFFRHQLSDIQSPLVIWSQADLIADMARFAPDFWGARNLTLGFSATEEKLNEMIRDQISKRSPLQGYLDALLQDQTLTLWQNLFLPLQAIHYAEYIRHHKIQATLSQNDLEKLKILFANRYQVAAHQTIFQEGEVGSECYIILRGSLEASVRDALGNEIVIERLHQGDVVGEVAFVKNIPRTATVRSIEPCELIVLTKARLRAVATEKTRQKTDSHDYQQFIIDFIKWLNDVAEVRYENTLQVPTEVISPLRRFASQDSPPSPVPVDVFQLIEQKQHLLILGRAGTGKTTLLRRLTLDLAQVAQQHVVDKQPIHLPIYLDMRHLSIHNSIEKFLLEYFKHYGIIQFKTTQDIDQLLAGMPTAFPVKQFIFIFDSLSDIQTQSATLQKIYTFITKYQNHRFVLACRLQDYALSGYGLPGILPEDLSEQSFLPSQVQQMNVDEMPLAKFEAVLLQTLTRSDIEAFLINYLGPERGRMLARSIYSDPQLIDLAKTPLALYAFVKITRNGEDKLPKNRGQLVQQLTDHFLERRDLDWWLERQEKVTTTPLSLRQNVLADLGLTILSQRALTASKQVWLDIIARQMTLYNETKITSQAEVSDTIVDYVCDELLLSGLIQYCANTNQARLEFTNATIQEFFAALALNKQQAMIESYLSYLSPLSNLHYWYGVIVLLYGIAPNREALFAQMLGEGSDYARIWLAALCLANSGQEIAVAFETLQRALPQQTFALFFSLGLASYQLGRYPEALDYLLKATVTQPGNPDVEYEIASLYRQLQQYNRAIEHIEISISLRPDFVDAYNLLGITYYSQENYEDALMVFNLLTQLEPDNAYHHYNLGVIQNIFKDYEAARQSFQLALTHKSSYKAAEQQFDRLKNAFTSGAVQILKRIPILNKLTLDQAVMLMGRLQVVDYKAGDIVYHLGEMGDTAYIVEYGSIEMLSPKVQFGEQSQNQALNTHYLQADDFFGEVALLRSLPRTATVRCSTDVRLLQLHQRDYAEISGYTPIIPANLVETSTHRLLSDRHKGRRGSLDEMYDPVYLQEVLERQREVTLIMGDIHGSTFLTTAIGPQMMAAFLDEYLLLMSNIVINAGGAMDKSLGDSVMAVFGKYPERVGETETSAGMRALLAGFEMRRAYINLRERWRHQAPTFAQTGMGIGISTGEVKIGTVGAEGVMVGAAVNVSSKLSKMAFRGRDESEIYLDQRTYDMLKEVVQTEQLPRDYVLSKSSGVELEVYQIVGNLSLAADGQAEAV